MTGRSWVTVEDLEVQIMLDKWQGDRLERRLEKASLELVNQIASRARRYVHINFGQLKGSIFHEAGGEDAEALATAGASAPYAAIEDLRGTGLRWDEYIDWETAGKGGHSFMSRAVKESLKTADVIFAHWLDPDVAP